MGDIVKTVVSPITDPLVYGAAVPISASFAMASVPVVVGAILTAGGALLLRKPELVSSAISTTIDAAHIGILAALAAAFYTFQTSASLTYGNIPLTLVKLATRTTVTIGSKIVEYDEERRDSDYKY